MIDKEAKRRKKNGRKERKKGEKIPRVKNNGFLADEEGKEGEKDE